jgi:hypothetical protein
VGVSGCGGLQLPELFASAPVSVLNSVWPLPSVITWTGAVPPKIPMAACVGMPGKPEFSSANVAAGAPVSGICWCCSTFAPEIALPGPKAASLWWSRFPICRAGLKVAPPSLDSNT